MATYIGRTTVFHTLATFTKPHREKMKKSCKFRGPACEARKKQPILPSSFPAIPRSARILPVSSPGMARSFWGRLLPVACSVFLFACDRSEKHSRLSETVMPEPVKPAIAHGTGDPSAPEPEPQPQPQSRSLESEAREAVERWKEQIWQRKGDAFYAILYTSEEQTHLGLNSPPKINRYPIEAKGLRVEIFPKSITQADKLNGLEWKGSFQHFANTSRHGKHSQWVDGLWNPRIDNHHLNPIYELEKRDGKWSISLSPSSTWGLIGVMEYEKADTSSY